MKITEKALEETTEYTDNMSTAPAVYNKTVQAVIPKSMILDLVLFDSD